MQRYLIRRRRDVTRWRRYRRWLKVLVEIYLPLNKSQQNSFRSAVQYFFSLNSKYGQTIVEVVLSDACNFNLMYTAMEVAVEQSSIFTSLCRQGTEIFHDNVEKVFADFVYPLRQNRRYIWVKTSKWSSKVSETGAVLQEAVQKGILNWNWNRKKKKIPRQELNLQDYCALASSEKQVDCWLIRVRISPESA